MLRATHTTLPAAYETQLGADVTCPPIPTGALQVAPLKTVAINWLLEDAAAQMAFPSPSSEQLGLEKITPPKFCQAPQVDVAPLNLLTKKLPVTLRAPHSTVPDASCAQDGSDVMLVVLPMDL
jgi:hypothetical protein